jgi:hypothetical protein
MKHIDTDLSIAVARLVAAIQALKVKRTDEARELVCIETRAVLLVFEDVCFWLGFVDPVVHAELQSVFREAVDAMASVDDPLLHAVNDRYVLVREFDLARVSPELEAAVSDS